MKTLLLAIVLTTMTSASFAKEKSADRKPASIDNNVMVGGDAELDACGGYGLVLATTSLISLKKGKMDFSKVDINAQVYSCDTSANGEFIGIIIPKPGQDCGVSGTIKTRQEYKGPCKSGWIKKSFFELLAG